ncbi:hypothetical protein AC611_22105 [Xanthomonas phaseoli pv. phaseoli]|nr:hypothetical protein AC609_15160 [Xanthomonas phaseoli pv. phaseoli]AZU31109.1 hypothetical protein AC801_14930 [Xanthomonas sp. ISO98C4]AZU15298.1 hypothetical protein AC609_22080 [Xanthomonas phaseoli pv. phaseoli]AZU26765.1 hypothetical protein AC611_15210 [Xanthomonas phaseoli pv. phaseoli]AZU28059.1 hypothetical protein AC611_22105 [Xanthomonas phaseoli pv. phaseoli]
MYSGPLSQRITAGLPRHSMICSSDRITRADGSDRSTSIPSPSRLKSSSTLNSRKLRPSANWSCMKSIDQTWLIASGTARGSGRSRTSRFLGLIRRFNSSSR